jgi:hypothetical protein
VLSPGTIPHQQGRLQPPFESRKFRSTSATSFVGTVGKGVKVPVGIGVSIGKGVYIVVSVKDSNVGVSVLETGNVAVGIVMRALPQAVR